MVARRFFWLLFILCLPFTSFSSPDARVEIYNIRYWTHPNFTRIVIDTGKLREYVYKELSNPDRIYVDVYQAKLNPILHGKNILVNNEYISQIRIAQKTTSTVRTVADLDFEKIKHYRVYHLFDPFRIVIDIYPQIGRTGSPSTKSSTPPKPTEEGYTMIRQLGLGIRRVVIDPGHGGSDPGCVGKKGLKEKDVVLQVSLLLKKLLSTRKDLEVILTRETDISMSLDDRPVIANQKQADLFISIHANALPNTRFSGVETFYLNFSRDPKVNEIAARENATSTKNIGEMTEIIKKIVRNSKIVESKELAKRIQKQLVKQLSQKYSGINSLGVKGGPLWVLIGGEMPSVLVEISYLSNPRDEARLSSPQYLQEVARGIYDGILEYIHSLGKG
ncbi:MAG: AMIN domain-containing protein [Candidatus Aminicenantes bacterium]|nr:AMIN domain-containing protein [Candidatus Aminicenantes bacterium]